MRLILFIIIAVCLAGAIYLYARSRSARNAQRKKAKEETKIDPALELKNATIRRLQLIIKLCIAVKLENEEKVLAKLLALADSLKDLLPRCNEKYPEKETTWKINRMADGHLPKIIEPYVMLEKEQRDQRREELLELLDKMKGDVDEIRELLSQDNEMAYDSKARFLETAYNKI